ncbi:heptaprenyl diphosphate synthase component 1 [Cohnella terricola]|uniref:Heptaprenyl diphosphate synthase n=1 Tax=Cohnella terricola TaxID=1289167 RepID=A0A559JXF5_9BACL|nr:heptaprenyl diphosphate synthase component 1 [Cohnella terricola]TVY04564.1 heptaprenyl diphosphate synthase [Cohnella terricola]
MSRARINQLASKYMSHDMISLHTDLPDFPEGRISLLYTVLSHQPSSASHKELLSVVTTLVQMGLDTHDMVENSPSGTTNGVKGMRTQQLRVLAGDYFSSRFYHLLSQAGQIEMIRRLSEAVCNINQLKMNFYGKLKQMKMNAEEYLHCGAELKSGLFLAFTGVMGGLYERLWPEIVERFSRCEVLMHELAKVEKMSSLAGSWGVWHILQEGAEEDRNILIERGDENQSIQPLIHKYEIAEKLSAHLRQSATQLQVLIQKLQSDNLLRELQPLIEPFVKAGQHRATALKELG